MTSQAERDFRRIFTGNTAHYLDVEQYRSRIFLQRNITSVLADHERRRRFLRFRNPAKMIDQVGRKVIPAESYEAQPAKKAQNSRKSRWSVEELCKGVQDGSIRPQRTLLKIQPKALTKRSPQSLVTTVGLSDAPSKRLKQSDIRCYCGLTIWGPQSREKDPLVKKAQECTISTAITPTGELRACIDMDGPLIVNTSELFVGVQRSGYSKLTITNSYYMEIMFEPLDFRETWPTALVKAAKGRPNAQTDNDIPEHIKNDQILVAKWTKLPTCPPKGTLLSIQAFKNRKPYRANISLDLDAAWSQSLTPLEHYNSQIRLSLAARFPTPISEAESSATTVTVVWSFGGVSSDACKTLAIKGYLCPACQRRKFVTYDLFHFHLITSHDLFKFRVTKEERNEADSLQILVRIEVAVADDYRNKAANHVKDERELRWERPRHPLNLQAFLAGDEEWIGKPRRRHQQAIPLQIPKASSSKLQIVGASIRASQEFDSSAVWDLSGADRKKHPVPAAPAEVTFFRATTKRPLKEGEPLSESDDDIDEAWFRHKHQEIIASYPEATPQEQEFIQKYDAYMFMEEISGNTHLADALVRFCRLHKDWLKRLDMYAEFQKNAASLISGGSIGERVLQGCIQTINQESTAEEPPKRKRRGRRRKVIMSDDEMDVDYDEGSEGPKNTPVDVVMQDTDEMGKSGLKSQSPLEKVNEERGNGRGYNVCSCGEPIKDLRTAITCVDFVCPAPMYHLRCVNLQSREPDWVCTICSTKKDGTTITPQ